MTEASPPPRDGIPRRPRTSWDIGAISQALDRQPEPTRDVAHGPGIRYQLGEHAALTLELFPPHQERPTGIVRLSTEDSRQEFYRQPPPALREEGLIFKTGDHRISLSPAGEITTHRSVPEEGPEAPQDTPEDGDEASGRVHAGGERSGDPAALQGVIQPGLPESREGQPRVTYGGRLGTAPRTKTTPKGKFVMEFPVAVAAEGREKPEWRDTVVFDDKARRLEGVLTKGVYVDVVAYEHRKLKKDAKGGATREVREYYATSVTPKVRTVPGAEDARDGQRP